MSNNSTYGDVHVNPIIEENNTEYPMAQVVILNNPQDKLLLINTYQYARTIRILVTIDAFFVFFNLFKTFNYIYIFSLIMLYFGYYGAMYYRKLYITSYIFYLYLNVLANILYILYVLHNKSNLPENNMISTITFSFLNFMINIWIIKICYNFTNLLTKVKSKNMINNLSSADSIFLYKSSWNKSYLM